MPGSYKGETKKEISNRLRNVRSIISKHGHDPAYKVKSKESQYHGYDIEKLKEEEYNLETMKAHQEHAEKLLKRKQPLFTIARKKGEIETTKKTRKKRNLQNSSCKSCHKPKTCF